MLLLLIGFFTGIISGMGMGGGTVLIPALVFIVGTTQHIAQSVNLFAFLPTALIAVFIHSKNKLVRYKIAACLFVSGIIGAFFGSRMAIILSSQALEKLFGFFLFAMGLYELLRKKKR